MTKRVSSIVLILIFSITVSSLARAQDENANAFLGHWLTGGDKELIELYLCEEDKICGKVVWMRKPVSTALGTLKVDTKNPDRMLRNQSRCGAKSVFSLQRKSATKYHKGKVYVAKRGSYFGMDLKLLDDGTMRMRGFPGIKALGKTYIWTRPKVIEPFCLTQLEP